MKSRVNPKIVARKMIAGYCISEEKKKGIIDIAKELDINACFFGREAAGKKVGYIMHIDSVSVGDEQVTSPLEQEALIMSGLKSSVIDKVLGLMRKKDITVDLKCTVTAVNQNWSLNKLIEELKREHESMHKNK